MQPLPGIDMCKYATYLKMYLHPLYSGYIIHLLLKCLYLKQALKRCMECWRQKSLSLGLNLDCTITVQWIVHHRNTYKGLMPVKNVFNLLCFTLLVFRSH